MLIKVFPGLVMTVLTPLLCAQQEYFVSPDGNDTGDGLTPATALGTIQAGVDRLQPGDTLTVLPGEYFESVRREGLGNNSVDTVIRAATPRTVVIRGDVPAPVFEPVEGYRFIYRAPWEDLPTAVLEVDTLTALQRSLSRIELEFIAGAWYLNEEEQMLYISSSDLQPPAAHHYRVAAARQSGLYLDKATRVRVEGIVATGFYPEDDRMHSFSRHVSGIMLNDSVDSVIANCVAFLNGNGICIVRGSGNLIEDSEAYGNYSNFHSPSGNIVVFEPNNTTARRNIAHTTRVGSGAGIKFYSTFHGPALLEENIVWGSRGGDIWTKGANAADKGMAVRNSVLGSYAVHNKDHNLMGGRNEYRRNNPDPTTLVIPPTMDREAEFADPSHLDFRLQSTSVFRTSGEGGKHVGPHPFSEDVFFVGPEGSDDSDGLSVTSAWRTLDHAVKRLQAGQTLYILGGDYRLSAPLKGFSSEDAETQIRARGKAKVKITTPVEISAAQNLALSRITFAAGLSLSNSSTVTIENCIFEGANGGIKIESCSTIRLLHNEFKNSGTAAVTLSGHPTADIFLTGNLFATTGAAAFQMEQPAAESIAFSDYNAFAFPVVAEVAGKQWRIADWQQHFDRHSTVLSQWDRNDKDDRAQLMEGPWGRPIGRHLLFIPEVVSLVGPFVHSVSDRSVNIEWFVSVPALSRVSWGRKGGDGSESRNIFTRNFGALTITGLEPGVDYWFKIDAVDPGANPVAHDNFYLPELERIPLAAQAISPDAGVSFTTRTEALPPRELFLSPAGDDSHDGLSPDTAWRTLNRAADQVRPGDTVTLLEGRWQETAFMRVGGEPDKRITWQSAPGAKVLLDGMGRNLKNGMVFVGKTDTTVDGLYFRNFGTGGSYEGMVSLRDSDRITLSRSFFDGRGPGYSPYGFHAASCVDLTITNCVVTNAFNGSAFFRCPNLRIENTIFLRNLIAAIIAVNKPEEKIYFANNIVVDSLPIKQTVQLFEIPEVDCLVQSNNGFFLRRPEAERRNAFFFYRSAGQMTPGEYFSQFGDNGSLLGDPRFAGLVDVEFAPDVFPPDQFMSRPEIDFPFLFTTHPEWIERGIGLEPEVFRDFHFNK